MRIVQAFSITPLSGQHFNAAVARDDADRLFTMSNREGHWQPDDKLHFADLLMPHHTLHEWDVEEIPIGDLPDVSGMQPPSE